MSVRENKTFSVLFSILITFSFVVEAKKHNHHGFIYYPEVGTYGKVFNCPCELPSNARGIAKYGFDNQEALQKECRERGLEYIPPILTFSEWQRFKSKYGKLTDENAKFILLESSIMTRRGIVTPARMDDSDSSIVADKRIPSSGKKDKFKKSDVNIDSRAIAEADKRTQKAEKLVQKIEKEKNTELFYAEKKAKEAERKIKQLEMKLEEKERLANKEQKEGNVVATTSKQQKEKEVNAAVVTKNQSLQRSSTSLKEVRTVVVKGVGVDKDSAVRDAMRVALERVVGIFVDSRTLVQNAKLELDEVYVNSRGFVNNINILSETHSEGQYVVSAKVDVDVNPDSALMSQLTMIMTLNDPRIAVIVLKNQKGQIVNDGIAETALNEKLLGLGFTHVVDANFLSKSQNLALLNSLYVGDRGLVKTTSNGGVDYLVLGEVLDDNNATGKKGCKSRINVKILKYDTGEIVGVFGAVGDGDSLYNAIADASVNAALKLEEKFKKINYSIATGVRLTVVLKNESIVNQLVNDIKRINGTRNVLVRERFDKTVVIDVQCSQRADVLLKMLKEKSFIKFSISSATSNAAKIVLE